MDSHTLATNQETVSVEAAGSVYERGGHPRSPRIEVRVVLVAVVRDRLAVVLTEARGTGFRLPQGPAIASEALDADANRIVRQHIGQQEHYLEQLYTLGVDEDGQWTVIVAYLALTWFAGAPVGAEAARWFGIGALPELGPADQMLLEYGLMRLRAKIGYTTIAFRLLPPTFTLPELQSTYEVILGRRLDKRNFRRRVIAADFLEPTGDKRRDGSHRPAVVYRFRAAHDREQYLTPVWANAT
jgi:8-oxo-dGTP diphosphatase